VADEKRMPSFQGMSAINQMRAQQEWKQKVEGAPRDEQAEKLNKWFEEWSSTW